MKISHFAPFQLPGYCTPPSCDAGSVRSKPLSEIGVNRDLDLFLGLGLGESDYSPVKVNVGPLMVSLRRFSSAHLTIICATICARLGSVSLIDLRVRRYHSELFAESQSR